MNEIVTNRVFSKDSIYQETFGFVLNDIVSGTT